jgi:hypothetical protein
VRGSNVGVVLHSVGIRGSKLSAKLVAQRSAELRIFKSVEELRDLARRFSARASCRGERSLKRVYLEWVAAFEPSPSSVQQGGERCRLRGTSISLGVRLACLT